MSRSKKQPKKRQKKVSLFQRGVSRGAALVAAHPLQVGGTTLFLIATTFVAVNAIWNQTQHHPSTFMVTRGAQDVVHPVRRPVISTLPVNVPLPSARPAAPEVPPRIDAAVPPMPADVAPRTTGSIPPRVDAETTRSVQQVLNSLGLYQGTVDGLSGPQTRQAVENYRKIVGLEADQYIDTALLQQLGLAEEPARSSAPVVQTVAAPVSTGNPDSVMPLEQVQQALRSFGHDNIQADGKLGQSTRNAIREFQSLFNLKITGEPNAELTAKMKEIGLVH